MSFQQKEISGFLTYLWQTDPCKAKWSILAKAYSIIRDSKGKENAPLDVYLAINGPFIGIIAPENYLVMLGWEISLNGEGQVSLRRDSDLDVSVLDHQLLTSNVSVADIIQHSYDSGYIVDDGSNMTVPDNQPVMMMATSAQLAPSNGQMDIVAETQSTSLQSALVTTCHEEQPGSTGVTGIAAGASVGAVDADAQDSAIDDEAEAEAEYERNLVKAIEADLGILDADEEEDEDMEANDSDDNSDENSEIQAPADVVNETEGNSTTQADLVVPQAPAAQIQAQTSVVTDTQDHVYSPTAASWINGAMGTIAAMDSSTAPIAPANPVSALANSNFSFNGHYPYNQQFDPSNSDLDFDPFMGDPFNPFDMSDYVNDNMFSDF